MFSEVIGKFFSSLLPVEERLFMIDATPHTVEVHVKCFGAFPAHVAGEYWYRAMVRKIWRNGADNTCH